jgi:hypothetical protein
MKIRMVSALVSLPMFATPIPATEAHTNDEIRQLITRQLIANYASNCACPYNTTRNKKFSLFLHGGKTRIERDRFNDGG